MNDKLDNTKSDRLGKDFRFIGHLKYAKSTDWFIAFIFKPFSLMFLYVFSNWLSRKFHKTGFQFDYNAQIMNESLNLVHERYKHFGSGLSRWVMDTGLNCVLMFCIIDPAYNTRLRKYLETYCELAIQNKMTGFQEYERRS